MSMYAQRGNLTREAGWGFLFDPDGGLVHECSYLFCVHCGGQWERKPGSGRLYGGCQNCGGYVCENCCVNNVPCVAIEQRLENIEAGRDEFFKPVRVQVVGNPPKSAGGLLLGSS